MKITKLDAGISQLKEAIYLFFECRDPIAVHTVGYGLRKLMMLRISLNTLIVIRTRSLNLTLG
ncbi:MAG: hypothetical protein JRD93_22080 [Deltaproteobacteria bacterium]|nr:hypothetical protein [Deltaproteobacteria bacterium]